MNILQKSFMPFFLIFAIAVAGCQGTRRANIQTRELAGKGKFDEALKQAEKALAMAEQDLDNFNGHAAALDNLAIIYQKLGKYEKAAELFKKALAIREQNLSANDSGIAVSLNLYGSLLKAQGKFTKAAPLLERSVKILKSNKGKRSPEVAMAETNIGDLYYKQSRFEKAEKSYKNALSILEGKRRGFKQETGVVMANLALLYQAQGKFDKAVRTIKKAISKQKSALGSNHPDIGVLLNTLSQLNAQQGHYTEAEEQCRDALGILEKSLGSNHPRVALMLRNYASILVKQARYGEAVPMIKKSLEIQKKTVGEKHPDVAGSQMMLARIYYDAGWYDKAISAAQKAILIREAAFGTKSSMLAKGYNSLGEMYRAAGSTTEALTFMQKALGISEATYGKNHVETAKVQSNLAALYVDTGRYEMAKKLYKSAIDIFVKNLGESHPRVTSSQHGLAKLYMASGNTGKALEYIRKASSSFSGNIHNEMQAGLADSAKRFRLGKELFQTYMKIVSDAAEKDYRNRTTFTDEGFKVMQLAQITGTSQALSKMAARFAATSESLAALVRQREDKIAEIKGFEELLIKSVGMEQAKRNQEKEKATRKQIETAKKDLKKLDKQIERKFPQYTELTSPKPFSVKKIQDILKKDEAMLAYFVSPDETYAFLVKKNSAVLKPTGITEKQLADAVKHLRYGLDPIFITEDIPDYDMEAGYRLYEKIVAPVEPMLSGVAHITVVPAAALESLPLSVLVKEKPVSKDYLKAKWFADDYAVSVVPSVSSLRALRAFARPSKSSKSFVGFGDPRLKGKTSGPANVPVLRQMDELPESSGELKAIAKTLKAPKNTVFLRKKATEKQVRDTMLDDYSVVAFATHGLMAGDFKGLAEPALVLTPPKYVETDRDNGLLTASEISELKLDAEWVVLSACNTAAPSGEPGAEGLSGLAKAFFYAGSRSMLVSNWQVETNASVSITTGIFARLAKDKTMPKAEALRKSMYALRHDKDEPMYAHPMFWAPFSLVGEGGVMSK